MRDRAHRTVISRHSERAEAIANAEFLQRALTAYFRDGGAHLPSKQSRVVVLNGLKYVHLVNANGTIAVYRVDCLGRVKQLSRPPKELA